VREVKLHGRTARFDMRAPGLLEEAMLALKKSPAAAPLAAALPGAAAQVAGNLH